ncbi:MAG TPA: heparan-alpha-glucosaminide N-acetyltransferase domain-containing protein, partial [Candidatus Lokiarchaeia archaeon]|nr:heparan-alpha-glucosaminide N-acetyltransferase domain-containing protein [Candidatus Lokiarchaeia archaeon]
MRRYASIDFLRGFAIFMMIALHTIQDSLDSSLINNIGTLPLISGVALILLNFMGGLAGFFLLVSAIGNMISMQRHLQAGKPVKELAVRQIVGGLILLLFACLTEGIIGYKG